MSKCIIVSAYIYMTQNPEIVSVQQKLLVDPSLTRPKRCWEYAPKNYY